MEAARALEASGISAEVIDLRSLKPLDEDGDPRVRRARPDACVVVHEASGLCGVGAEIAAIVAEKAFGALKAPVMRLTGPDAPAPSSYALEQAFVPQPDGIVAAVKKLVAAEAQ